MQYNSNLPNPLRQDGVGPIGVSGTDAESAFPSGALVTEPEIREVLEPEVVEQVIDHQRHHHAADGTRFWDAAEFEDLRGVIGAAKGVAS